MDNYSQMKVYTLNVGMGNNPLTEREIISLLTIAQDITPLKHRFELGEYVGNEEDTMVVNIWAICDERTLEQIIVLLCAIMTQECIAIKGKDYAKLIYDNRFDGEKLEFDEQYFINY